ncbi:P-granule-associated novel protein 1 [Drosophila tropicalis]|uniref:P-granule-associated novel protein 1 n=1 Tax=Drosophila tropicalis TaxID=46794 RepID=UPI0035AB6AB7
MLLIRSANSETLEEIPINSLQCQEYFCEGLNYPNSSQVAYFMAKATKDIKDSKTLLLHSSNLTNLPLNIFHTLVDLEELLVWECQVKRIDRKCFENAKALKKISLAGNLIDKLDKETFSLAKEGLEELDLSDNLLEDLSSQIFSSLTQLKRLQLANNRLRAISPNAFPSNMQLLTISQNKPLKNLHLSVNLTELWAINCDLERVQLDGYVVNVQLEDNFHLDMLKVKHAQVLRQLHLANTKLRNLDFLSNATQLIELDLTGMDKLSTTPLSSIFPKQLQRLSISSTFSSTMLPHLKNLSYLNILHNDMHEIYLRDNDYDLYVEDKAVVCEPLDEQVEAEYNDFQMHCSYI